MYPFKLNKKKHPETLEMGDALVKPYYHSDIIRIRYELMKWDTRNSYNQRLQKEINKVLKNT